MCGISVYDATSRDYQSRWMGFSLVMVFESARRFHGVLGDETGGHEVDGARHSLHKVDIQML